jgi:modification target Cys-rich repeat protein
MDKLKLELDALEVETFRTTAARIGEPGTVRGHGGGEVEEAGPAEEVAITSPQTVNGTCFGTCQRSCWGTCDESCQGTCAWSCQPGCSDSCATGGAICCG